MSDLQFVVILPRRRVTSVADAEAAIVEARQAKTAILAALASLEPAPAALGEPERCGARPFPAGSEGDDGTECMLPAGHGWPHDDMPGYAEPEAAAPSAAHHATPAGEPQCLAKDGRYFCTAQQGHGGPEHIAYGSDGEICHIWPVASLPMCTEPAPANHPATCARLEGHRPPHHDLAGFEWGDVPPHYATPSEPRCGAYSDEDGEGWICTAQPGHGGGEHVTYDLDGEVKHRWPVPADTIEQRKRDDADRRAAIARGIALGAAAPLAARPALRVVVPDPVRDPAGDIPPGLADGAGDEPDDVAAEIVRDMLLLVSVEIPLDVVAAWTPYQRRVTAKWAAGEHLHAGDNDDVVRLPKPGCVTDAQAESSRS